MSWGRPPRLAILLLKWFGLTNNEAFAGDLIEEFNGGRTAAWFWRQTLTAIRGEIGRVARTPNVQALFVAYGMTVPPILGFLKIRGAVHIERSLISVLSIAVFIAALLWIDAKFRTPGYWGKVAHQSLLILSRNCGIVLVVALKGEDLWAPFDLLLMNILWLGIDIAGALLSAVARARRRSSGHP